MKTIGHWIDGQQVIESASRVSPVWNPGIGVQQAELQLANLELVSTAVASAARAFISWRQESLTQRTKILFAFREIMNSHIDELALVVSDEHGKIFSDARGEVQRGLEVVEFACGIPTLLKGEYSDQVSGGIDLFTYRQPLGVVVGITPFNFPAMVPMWMFPIAIATGNTFILKPSERDPSASLLMAGMWKQAGLPDGVFNVVQGDAVAVNALLNHPDIAAISFVGSTPIAQVIHSQAIANGKRVQALGGAKNHAIVMPDADLDFAASHLVAAAFGSAGERCMAISAAVAVGDIATPLLEKVSDLARVVKVGSGRDPTSEIGPVISSESRQRITDLISSGEDQGADILVDGRGIVVPGFEEGFYVGPTVIDNVTTHMDVYTNEIFGPVLSTLRVRNVDEAIALVNANRSGNGAVIFTSNGESARRFHREIHAGMIGVNVPVPVPMAYHSFGGWKDSLFGDYHIHGPEGVRFYTRAKAVTQRWPVPRSDSDATFSFPTSQ